MVPMVFATCTTCASVQQLDAETVGVIAANPEPNRRIIRDGPLWVYSNRPILICVFPLVPLKLCHDNQYLQNAV